MNTKHYTSIEQGKKLLKLGLNPDTSDMYYLRVVGETYNQDTDMVLPMTDNNSKIQIGSLTEEYYPAEDMFPSWSLSALLEVMPKIKEFYYPSLYKGSFSVTACMYSTQEHDIFKIYTGKDFLEAAYNMVVWLLENGFIKKESNQ